MRRITIAALFAAPLLLAAPDRASAGQPCLGPFQCPCIGLFSRMHQHGPLYNYGPYTGYAPFGPYGPWNEYLQWTGDNYGPGDCKGCKKSHTGNPHPLCGGGKACGGVGCGHSPLFAKFHKGGCSTCGGGTVAAADQPPAPAAMGQYAGYPAPQNPYAAYGYPGYGSGYGYPPAPAQSPVTPAGAPGR